MAPALVILAGGLGSRFGGDKELAQVGPNGEALLDYTVFDALRFGYAPVVLVVRSTTSEKLQAHLHSFGFGASPLVYVAQDHDALAPPRAKPWGTVHAVVSTREVVPGAFAVANADDLYGPASLRLLSNHLQAPASADLQHLMAFELGKTLSPTGAVNRGVCEVAGGVLTSIREERGLRGDTDLPHNTLVSMNLWGFTESMMARLERHLAQFVDRWHDDESAEDLLPDAVGEMIRSDSVRVAVHSTQEQWVGVTYKDDLEWARARVEAMVEQGVYPTSLLQANKAASAGG